MKDALKAAIAVATIAAMLQAAALSVAVEPGLAKQFEDAAAAARAEGNYAAAIREYRRMLELYPNEPGLQSPIYLAMSEAAGKAGDAGEAQEFRAIAQGLDPDLDRHVALYESQGSKTRGGPDKVATAMAIMQAAMGAYGAIKAARQPAQQLPPQAPVYPPAAYGQPGYPPPPANGYAPMPGYQDPNAQAMGQPQMGYPPQMGQPQMGQPQMGQPQMGQPQMGQPQMGQPQMGQPQMGQQQMGQPQMGYQPQMGQPQMGQQQMGQQQMGQPQMGQPQMGQPQMGYQQQMGQPQMGQPQMGQQQMGQPQMGQPQMGQQQMGQQQMGQPQMGQPQPGMTPQGPSAGYPLQQQQPGYPPQGVQAGGYPPPNGQLAYAPQPAQSAPAAYRPAPPSDPYRPRPNDRPPTATRGEQAAPLRVVHDHWRFGGQNYFENSCGALLTAAGGELIFTGGAEGPHAIPATDILEIRMNTAVGKDVGAFHIITKKGLYLHLALESGNREDARAAVDSLRQQLGLEQ